MAADKVFESKLKLLSERTDIEIDSLRNLPEESIVDYFNKSSGTASRVMVVGTTVSVGACGAFALLNVFSGNLFLAALFASMAVINGNSAIQNIMGADTNKMIGKDIRNQLSTGFDEIAGQPVADVESEDRFPVAEASGPINGPEPA